METPKKCPKCGAKLHWRWEGDTDSMYPDKNPGGVYYCKKCNYKLEEKRYVQNEEN